MKTVLKLKSFTVHKMKSLDDSNYNNKYITTHIILYYILYIAHNILYITINIIPLIENKKFHKFLKNCPELF